MTAKVVHLNGRFVDPAAATVSLLDPGYLLGIGVFATLRGDDGVCFRPEAHLAMLADGARALDLAVPDTAELVRLADAVAARVGGHARVRVTVSATATSVIGEPMVPPTPEELTEGIPVVTVRARRNGEGSPKTTSYAAQVVGRAEAHRRGAGEGLQLTADGAVAGATMANVFLVRGRTLRTPSLASGCRAGVTRGAIVELAAGLDLAVVEERVDPADLTAADEVFLTSTRIGCLPVRELDGAPVRRGPIAGALDAALAARIAAERAERVRGGASPG